MNTPQGTYTSAIYFIIALAVALLITGPGLARLLAVITLALFAVLDFGEATGYPLAPRNYNIGRLVGVVMLVVGVILWFLGHPLTVR